MLDLGDGITVRTTANNHPDGGISYRIQYGDKSCCYVTDTSMAQIRLRGSWNFVSERICSSMMPVLPLPNIPGIELGSFHLGRRFGLLEAAGAGRLILFTISPSAVIRKWRPWKPA